MHNILRGLIGTSAAFLLRGIRFGVEEYKSSAVLTTQKVQPFESAGLRSIPVKTLDEILCSRKTRITLGVQAYESGMLCVMWRKRALLMARIRA